LAPRLGGQAEHPPLGGTRPPYRVVGFSVAVVVARHRDIAGLAPWLRGQTEHPPLGGTGPPYCIVGLSRRRRSRPAPGYRRTDPIAGCARCRPSYRSPTTRPYPAAISQSRLCRRRRSSQALGYRRTGPIASRARCHLSYRSPTTRRDPSARRVPSVRRSTASTLSANMTRLPPAGGGRELVGPCSIESGAGRTSTEHRVRLRRCGRGLGFVEAPTPPGPVCRPPACACGDVCLVNCVSSTDDLDR